MTALPVAGQPQPHQPGKIERALLNLSATAADRLRQPKNILRWLSLSREFDLRHIHIGQLSVEVPAGLLPDCGSCLEVCCAGPNAVVSLRLRDIAALMDAGLDGFIGQERPKEGGAQSVSRAEADGSIFHTAFPVLRRDATGTCALLSEDRTCSAYPAWPLSCARYPYALDYLNRRVFLAKGCTSHKRVYSGNSAPIEVRELLRACVDAYNQRVRDVVLLHVALPELDDLGLLQHLSLPKKLARRLEKLRSAHPKGHGAVGASDEERVSQTSVVAGDSPARLKGDGVEDP